MAAVVIMVVLFAVWRLMQGPVELDWLTPYVETAIRQSGVGVKVALSGVRIGIDRSSHQLDLRARNVRLALPDGKPLLRFPEMATRFGLGDLLHGRFAPAQVVVEAPVLHLVRSANGAISAEVGGDEQTPGMIGPGTLEELAGPPARDAPLGLLHRIEIRGATVYVDDRASGRTWRADHVDIAIERGGKGARGDFSFAVPIGDSMPELHASYRYLAERQLLDLDLSIDGVQPTAIPPLTPELAQLRHLAAPVSGTLRTRIDLKRGAAQGSRLDLALGKGVVHSDWLPGGSIAIEKGRLNATYAPEAGQVRIDGLALDLGGGAQLSVAGVLANITPELIAAAADARPSGQVAGRFSARLTHVPVARFPQLWPTAFSPGGRAWALENIHDGVLDEASVRVALDLDPVAHTAGLVKADGTLRYHGATVNYLDGLPPVRKVDGTATFSGDQLVFTPTSGVLKGLKVTGGTLRLSNLAGPTEWLTIDLGLAGPLRDALEVIDTKPLRYAQAIGLDPGDAAGHSETQLHFKLPLLAHLKWDQVEYGAKAAISGASLRQVALGHGVSDGNFSLDLARTGAQLHGTAHFAGVPTKIDADIPFHAKGGARATFRVGLVVDDAAQQRLGFDIAPDRLKGPVAIEAIYKALGANRGEATAVLDLRDAALSIPEAGWKKPPGQPGTAKLVLDLDHEKATRLRQVQVSAPGLDGWLSAQFGPDHRQMAEVDIRRLAVGDSDIAGTVTRRAGGGWNADIHAARLAVNHMLKDATSGGAPSPASPPLAVQAKIDRLVFGPGRELRQVGAALLRTNGVWQSGQIDGRYADGHRVSLQFGQGDSRLVLRSDDLGDTLRLLDVADNVVGGRLRVDGQLSQSAGGRVLRAHIDGENYTVARAPVLTRLLALPSLTGLASALSGSGLPFMSLRGDIDYRGGHIALQRLLAFGESLGITARGTIDTDRDRLDLQGTVAPAYLLNSLVGSLPIVGPLLGGGSQGLLAANFRLSGPTADPQVSVNPLSALAPGILRQIFSPADSGPPQFPEPR